MNNRGDFLAPLGIYIHIPFCASKCAYCDFYSRVGAKSDINAYVSALIRHISEANMKTSSYIVDSIYFGGGTPTVIGEANLIKILKSVYKSFKVSGDCEITTEANPNTVSLRTLRKLRRAGFNRISFGMQSSDDSELRTLGRTHSFEDVKTAVAAAKAAKFSDISLDLMYGLPSQTLNSWLNSLDAAIELSPTHISCYSLKLECGTPLSENRESFTFPDDDLQADMYLSAVARLRDEGFIQYEISNFAKDGFSCRHNKKYWDLTDYWGFGASAHSLVDKKRFSYVSDISRYVMAITEDDELIDKLERINTSERAGEYLMLMLRTSEGISPEVLEKQYLTYFEDIEKVLLEYHNGGFVSYDGAHWSLTPEGFLISNRIIGDVLNALESSRRVVTPRGGYKRKDDSTCAQ